MDLRTFEAMANSRSATSNREEYAAWLRRREKETRDLLSRILFHLNDLPTINRQPNELLLHIFGRLAHKGTQYWPNWFLLTHVCRHWRTVALNCGSLWTYIEIDPAHRMTAFVGRSNDRDISLHMSPSIFKRSDLQDITVPLEKSASQVSSISMRASTALMANFFAMISGLNFPQLKSLDIKPSISGQGSMILPTFSVPTLVRLSIESVALGWGSHLFRHLTELRLITQHMSNSLVPTMTQFLDVLEASPSLKKLTIRYSGPLTPLEDPTCSIPRLVNLVHLTELHLINRGYDNATLLSHLNIPSDTFVDVACRISQNDPEADEILWLFPRQHDHLAFLPTTEFVTATWYDDDHPYFTIDASGPGESTLKINIELKSASLNDTSFLFAFFNGVGDVFISSSLVCFNIQCDLSLISEETWRHLFSRITTLKEIMVGGDEWDPWPHSLTLLDGLNGGTCPRLISLVFDQFLVKSPFTEVLQRCLKTRAESGMPPLASVILKNWVWEGDHNFEPPGLEGLCRCFNYSKPLDEQPQLTEEYDVV